MFLVAREGGGATAHGFVCQEWFSSAFFSHKGRVSVKSVAKNTISHSKPPVLATNYLTYELNSEACKLEFGPP